MYRRSVAYCKAAGVTRDTGNVSPVVKQHIKMSKLRAGPRATPSPSRALQKWFRSSSRTLSIGSPKNGRVLSPTDALAELQCSELGFPLHYSMGSVLIWMPKHCNNAFPCPTIAGHGVLQYPVPAGHLPSRVLPAAAAVWPHDDGHLGPGAHAVSHQRAAADVRCYAQAPADCSGQNTPAHASCMHCSREYCACHDGPASRLCTDLQNARPVQEPEKIPARPCADWLVTGALQKMVLVVTSVATKEVLERWTFDIQTDKGGARWRVGWGCWQIWAGPSRAGLQESPSVDLRESSSVFNDTGSPHRRSQRARSHQRSRPSSGRSVLRSHIACNAARLRRACMHFLCRVITCIA